MISQTNCIHNTCKAVLAPIIAASNKITPIFNKFRDDTFKFIKEPAKIAQRIGTISTVINPLLKEKIGKAIAAVGFLALLELIFTLSEIPGNINDFIKNITLKDLEGSLVGAGTLLSTPVNFMHDLCVFIKTLSTFQMIPVIAFFGVIALPFALASCGYGAAEGAYNLVMLCYERLQLNTHNLQAYLEKKLDVTPEERKAIEGKFADKSLVDREITVLKDKKINILTRRTDKKIVAYMKNMKEKLNDENKAGAIKDLKSLYTRKIVVTGAAAASLTALFATLLTSAITPISPFITLSALLAKHVVSLGKATFNKFFMTRWLNNAEWVKN